MRKKLCLCFILFVIISGSSAYGSKIIVNHDEWTLSNTGFSNGDAGQFALNIGDFFTNGQPGNFLVYTSNFGLAQNSLANTMTSAGHTWSIDTAADTSLTALQLYDGIFLADTGMDNTILTSYVNAGGNVYLAGGTTSAAGWTANLWNPFLNNFGLEFATGLNGYRGSPATTSTHPLFNLVNNLYYNNGNYVSLLDPSNPNTVTLEGINPNGLIAIYDPVPIPCAGFLMISGLGLLVALGRKQQS